ncbi:hypothetical protein FV242_33935 [Methylobacterium sp. WL64]|uniref:hypothetical protein n=1 Tax=Methylobacterium sp. WL64 TaxID=2603894 RepID=UPI0011C87380|nr:hypothetical protein [Methylobacterium sp. WL64]TXM96180.1 hypothetical protein FV242_33935 [Methylobacterium sp. WL64]
MEKTDRPYGIHLALKARLNELEGCWLDMTCACGRGIKQPIKMLVRSLGPGHHLAEIVPRLTCKHCGAKPATVHLCETAIRVFNKGEPPGWSVQLHPLA